VPDIPAIQSALAEHGLIMRGGFHPASEDNVPGDPATLVLVGNAGPEMWAAFGALRGNYADRPNPLDAWISDVLAGVAGNVGATALFPFGGLPHLPFQRWAQRAEPVHPSPVGVLIHPEYGLWHAYRGALAFPELREFPQPYARPSPCDSCADKPCLSACPVDAFGGDAYDVPACVGHITGPDTGDCMAQGCQARRACPVGRDYIYEPAQAGFHMRAFTGAQGEG
jgi:ferredoxin